MSNALKVGVLAGLALSLAAACTGLMSGGGMNDAMRSLPQPVRIAADTLPCEGLTNLFDCAVVAERLQIARASGVVTRDTSGLCFEGAGIASLCVPDDTLGGQQRRFYIGSIREPAFHLFYVHPDGDGLLAVSARTGKRSVIDDLPWPSPSGDLVAVSSLDLGSDTRPNRFRIHQVRNDSLPVVFEVAPDGWGPGRPVWIAADRVRFPMIRFETSAMPERVIGDSVTVVLTNGSWLLIPPTER